VYKDAAAYFDVNGSRQIYSKFRSEDSRERILHNVVHFFISLHLPTLSAAAKAQGSEATVKKSNLK